MIPFNVNRTLPFAAAAVALGLSVGTASAANLTIYPDQNTPNVIDPVGVADDAAPGFDSGSLRADVSDGRDDGFSVARDDGTSPQSATANFEFTEPEPASIALLAFWSLVMVTRRPVRPKQACA